jgi:hypothetical protein
VVLALLGDVAMDDFIGYVADATHVIGSGPEQSAANLTFDFRLRLKYEPATVTLDDARDGGWSMLRPQAQQ